MLLPALLLAFSIWLIHNLSLKYNDYLSVPVVARCNIPGHSSVSAGRAEITARCRATGYKVIKAYLRSGKNVEIPFRQLDMKHKEGDIYYVMPSDLKDYAHLIFGPEVTVEYFLSDTIFFRFPYENFRKVPVIPITAITYKDQFMAEEQLTVTPDSVMVYGEPFRIENLNAVYTRPINYTDLSEDVSGVVKLERLKNVRISESEVGYKLNVRRFVEITRSVPVTVVNVPSDKTLHVYPPVVEVALKCGFPLVDDPESGLRVEADYNDLQSSIGGRCILRFSSMSRGVISYEITPLTVSCVFEDR